MIHWVSYVCLQRRRTCFRMCCPRWLSSSAGNTFISCYDICFPPPHTYFTYIPDTSTILPQLTPIETSSVCQKQRPALHSLDLSFSHRAFQITELKTEVTNKLAMLERRVECEWCSFYTTPERT